MDALPIPASISGTGQSSARAGMTDNEYMQTQEF